MKSEHSANLMNLLVGLVLAAAMSIIIPILLNGGFSTVTGVSFFQDYISNLMMGFFVATWVPSPIWGIALAKKLHISNVIGSHFIQTAVVTVVMVVLMTIGQLFLKVGASGELVILTIRLIIPITVLIYPVLLIVTPIAGMISAAVCAKQG